VDGVTYSNLFLGNLIGDTSTFNLTATAPATIPVDATTDAVVTFGFRTVAGAELIGYADPGRTQRVVDVPVSGFGTAAMSLTTDFIGGNGLPVFSERGITWLFGQTPTPTPEPASLALLGTGLGVLALRLRARRRSRPDDALRSAADV